MDITLSGGTHTVDGLKSGEPVFNGYELGGSPGVPNTVRNTYIIQPIAANLSAFASGVNTVDATNTVPLSLVTPVNAKNYWTVINGVNVIKLDVPRSINLKFNGTTPAGNATFYGYDYGGYPLTEQRALVAGGTSNSSTYSCFAYLRAIQLDNPATNVSVGFFNLFGLPYYIFDQGAVLNSYFGGLTINPGTANITWVVGNTTSQYAATTKEYSGTITSGDCRGRVLIFPGFAAQPNGSNYLIVNQYVFGALSPNLIANQANILQLPPLVAVNPGEANSSIFANPFRARFGITPYSQPLP